MILCKFTFISDTGWMKSRVFGKFFRGIRSPSLFKIKKTRASAHTHTRARTQNIKLSYDILRVPIYRIVKEFSIELWPANSR